MVKAYKKTITYRCLKAIYYRGKDFGESGRILIESGNNNLLIPGIINICLSAELLLKSINASMSYLEDELQINGTTVYQGCDKTLKIVPSGTGHTLSDLFGNLPSEIQDEITKLARGDGYHGCVNKGLKRYDRAFVKWRYIYEENALINLGTHPLLQIVNAISQFCEMNCGCVTDGIADKASS